MTEMIKLLHQPRQESLSTQLRTAGAQLAALSDAGEFEPLSLDTCCCLHALRMFLDSAGDMADMLEDIAADRLPRERRMTPVGDLVRRIVERASK
jgi:hypothetical protein